MQLSACKADTLLQMQVPEFQYIILKQHSLVSVRVNIPEVVFFWKLIVRDLLCAPPFTQGSV